MCLVPGQLHHRFDYRHRPCVQTPEPSTCWPNVLPNCDANARIYICVRPQKRWHVTPASVRVCVRLCGVKRAVVMGTLRVVAVISTWARFTPLVKLGDYGEPPQTWSCQWHIAECSPLPLRLKHDRPRLPLFVQHLDRATHRVPSMLGTCPDPNSRARGRCLRVYGVPNGIARWLHQAQFVQFWRKNGAGSGEGRRGVSGFFARQPGA